MVLNNKAQVFFYSLMLGIIIIVLALAFSGPVKDIVDSARNGTTTRNVTYITDSVDGLGGTTVNGTITTIGLDCTNSTISTFDKGACVVADLTIFHFIGGLVFIAGAVIMARLVMQ